MTAYHQPQHLTRHIALEEARHIPLKATPVQPFKSPQTCATNPHGLPNCAATPNGVFSDGSSSYSRHMTFLTASFSSLPE